MIFGNFPWDFMRWIYSKYSSFCFVLWSALCLMRIFFYFATARVDGFQLTTLVPWSSYYRANCYATGRNLDSLCCVVDRKHGLSFLVKDSCDTIQVPLVWVHDNVTTTIPCQRMYLLGGPAHSWNMKDFCSSRDVCLSCSGCGSGIHCFWLRHDADSDFSRWSCVSLARSFWQCFVSSRVQRRVVDIGLLEYGEIPFDFAALSNPCCWSIFVISSNSARISSYEHRNDYFVTQTGFHRSKWHSCVLPYNLRSDFSTAPIFLAAQLMIICTVYLSHRLHVLCAGFDLRTLTASILADLTFWFCLLELMMSKLNGACVNVLWMLVISIQKCSSLF